MTIVTIVTFTPIYTHTRARVSANRKMRQDRHERHSSWPSSRAPAPAIRARDN